MRRITLATLLFFSVTAHAESPCARRIRDALDHAALLATSGKLDDASFASLQEETRAHPDRCAPGDYAQFMQRYADLLIVIGGNGLTDAERKLASMVRDLAPRRVATSGYDAAFHAFLDARARLASHAPPAAAQELLAMFDALRPEEILPTVALGHDRDGVMQGLSEIRRHLALGEVQAADAQAEELLRALQAETPPDAPDGGAATPAAAR